VTENEADAPLGHWGLLFYAAGLLLTLITLSSYLADAVALARVGHAAWHPSIYATIVPTRVGLFFAAVMLAAAGIGALLGRFGAGWFAARLAIGTATLAVWLFAAHIAAEARTALDAICVRYLATLDTAADRTGVGLTILRANADLARPPLIELGGGELATLVAAQAQERLDLATRGVEINLVGPAQPLELFRLQGRSEIEQRFVRSYRGALPGRGFESEALEVAYGPHGRVAAARLSRRRGSICTSVFDLQGGPLGQIPCR
jgi:hypothetical protein